MISFLKDDSITAMPDFKHRLVSAWIKNVAKFYGKRVGDVAYIFCSERKILQVNRQYLQHDYYTDIITFDYSSSSLLSGDIFISVPTVRSNASLFSVPFTQELHRVIIHGILHLTGQNDKTPSERAEMTRKEDHALSLLPYDLSNLNS